MASYGCGINEFCLVFVLILTSQSNIFCSFIKNVYCSCFNLFLCLFIVYFVVSVYGEILIDLQNIHILNNNQLMTLYHKSYIPSM